MRLERIKYTKKGKPYVEFKVKSGVRKGYITRRFGKIIKCTICKKRFFARNEQLKEGKGKFCSIRCAKIFTKKTSRKRELSKRSFKEIKNRLVYFGEDGKIYTEKKDKRGKIYRYYGEIKKCLVCGEDFFAEFSQIKLDRAKYCSRQCAKLRERRKGKEEVILSLIKEKKPIKILKPEQPEEKTEEIEIIEEKKEDEVKIPGEQILYKEDKIKEIEESKEELEEPKKEEVERKLQKELSRWRREERREEEKSLTGKRRPIGILVFGITIIYIGLYHFMSGLRSSGTIDIQYKNYMLTAINLLMGYGILRMSSWVIKLLYAYFIMMIAGIITAFYYAFFVEPSFKAFVSSQEFVSTMCFVFIPYVLFLIYLSFPEVRYRFK